MLSIVAIPHNSRLGVVVDADRRFLLGPLVLVPLELHSLPHQLLLLPFVVVPGSLQIVGHLFEPRQIFDELLLSVSNGAAIVEQNGLIVLKTGYRPGWLLDMEPYLYVLLQLLELSFPLGGVLLLCLEVHAPFRKRRTFLIRLCLNESNLYGKFGQH